MTKKAASRLMMVAFLIGLTSLQAANAQAKLSYNEPDDLDEAAIRGINQQFMDAVRPGDAVAVAQLYTTDAQLLPAGSNPIEGRAAIEDESVGIAVWYIKPEKSEEFEAFVRNILMPAAHKVEPKAAAQVRFWLPGGDAEEDGTLEYAFVFDPIVEGADYMIPSLLKRAYGTSQAEKYMNDFTTFHRGSAYREGYNYMQFVQDE